MKRRIAFITFIALLTIAAKCATNSYAAASQKFDAGQLTYRDAGNQIDTANRAGKVTKFQQSQFFQLQAQVEDAATKVHADLAEWQTSGKEPAQYSVHSQTLTAAVDRTVALANEVSK